MRTNHRTSVLRGFSAGRQHTTDGQKTGRESVDTVENAGLTLVEPVDNPTGRVVPSTALCYHRPLAEALCISAFPELKRPAYGPESVVCAGLPWSSRGRSGSRAGYQRHAWDVARQMYPQPDRSTAALSTTEGALSTANAATEQGYPTKWRSCQSLLSTDVESVVDRHEKPM